MIDFPEGRGAFRAPRYPIVSPVRFRTSGGAWIPGTTVNIGARGVLFRTAVAVPVSIEIELRIALLAEGTDTGAYIACSGHVVRATHEANGHVLVAVAIDQGHLRPAALEPPRSGNGNENVHSGQRHR